jgi:hypothetical protein
MNLFTWITRLAVVEVNGCSIWQTVTMTTISVIVCDNQLLLVVQLLSALKWRGKRGVVTPYHQRGLCIHLTLHEEEIIAGR